MKTKKKIIAILILVSISFFNFSFAFADGMMIMPVQDEYAWDKLIGDKIDPSLLPVGTMVGENSQQAFINWDEKKKIEKMMIVVDKENVNAKVYNNYGHVPSSADQLFWIVPVKSDCKNIKPYHYEKFSNVLDVISVEDESKNRLKSLKEIIYGMQIWPLISKFTKLNEQRYEPMYSDTVNGAPAWGYKSQDIDADVTVYKQIESFGVKTRILSAQSFDGLEEYLAGNYIRLDESTRNIIESYINGDYCFAVSNVMSPGEKGKLGLMLEFKPAKPFYPLYITSSYGNRIMSVDLYIDDAVKASMGRKELATQNYYLKNDFYYGKDDEILFKKGSVLSNIVLHDRAFGFTSDIYFENSVPRQLSSWVKLNYWFFMLVSYFVLSFALGILIFKKNWIRAGILNSFLGFLGILIGLVLPQYISKNKKGPVEALDGSICGKYCMLRSFRIGNSLILALPIFMLLMFTLSIFGGYQVQQFMENIIGGAGMGNEEFALVFFIFMLPLSFMLATLSNILRKILGATKINGDIKELLAGLMSVINNALEAVMLAVSLILFIAMGPKGWILGIIIAIILLWSVNYGKNNEKVLRKVLVSMPLLFLFFLLFGIFGAIVSMIVLYPYLVNYYYSKNIKEISEYYEKINAEKTNGNENVANKVQDVPLLGKAAIYSILLVLSYTAIELIIQAVFI